MEGAPHTVKRNLCVLGCPPTPVYKGGEGEAGRPCRARQEEGVLLELQVLVGFHLEERRKKEGRGGREGKGGAAPFP